jgi:hypothetical protein
MQTLILLLTISNPWVITDYKEPVAQPQVPKNTWVITDYREPVSEAKHNYPLRGSWWSGCSSWQHLTVGEHRGKFDHEWLKSLSYAELQSLHSDDHDGTLKELFVKRPTGFQNPAPKATSNCPGGVCPPQRFFRRR